MTDELYIGKTSHTIPITVYRVFHDVAAIVKKHMVVLLVILVSTFLISTFPRKEGNILFNDTLNTFYLLLYGVGFMIIQIAAATTLGNFSD